MMYEISYVLFQIILIVTAGACAVYVICFVTQKKNCSRIARLILFSSWVLQTGYILLRYIMAGYTPVTTLHEAVFFFAWSTTVASISFRWRYTVKNFGMFVSLLVFILLIVAAFTPREMIPLKPELQSFWLPVHAGLSLLSYGFFSLAFCGGIMYLIQEYELKSRRLGYFFSRLPSLDALDQLNSHCLVVGFVFLSLGMITGVLWLKQAWGVYWRWNQKEICSLLIWGIYLIQIHQWFSIGWRGRRAALMVVAGFVLVLLTLWQVVG